MATETAVEGCLARTSLSAVFPILFQIFFFFCFFLFFFFYTFPNLRGFLTGRRRDGDRQFIESKLA